MSSKPTIELETSTFNFDHVRWVLVISLITLLVIITYANTLSSGFIHDDTAEILQNPLVRDYSLIPKIFSLPAWGFASEGPYQFGSNYYRPVQYLLYNFLYHLFGANPFGYHLFKLLNHLAVSILLLRVVWGITSDYWIAFFSALLFSVHPANTEAVSWISGITDTSCAFFFLASFLLYLRDRADPSLLRLSMLSASFFFGLLSKEMMPTFLAVILVYAWITEGQRPSLAKYRRQLIPLAAVFLGYLALRMNAIGSFLDQRQLRYESLSSVQVLFNQTYLFCKYLKLFLLPYGLNAHHLFDPIRSPFDARFVVSSIVLGVLCFCFVKVPLRSSRPWKMALFGLCWFVITLSPVLIFLKRIGENLFAERYLYIPALGLCLTSGAFLGSGRQKSPKATALIFSVLLCTSALLSIERNGVWRNDLIFYETTARATPRSSVILNGLGTAYFKEGRVKEAIPVFEASIAAQPSIPAYKNLGYLYVLDKRYDDAISAYQKAIAIDATDAAARTGIGDAFLARGLVDEAMNSYLAALSLYPNSTVALFKYSEACVLSGRDNEAIAALKKIIVLSPAESRRAYLEMSKVYRAKNQRDLALDAERKASFGAVQLLR